MFIYGHPVHTKGEIILYNLLGIQIKNKQTGYWKTLFFSLNQKRSNWYLTFLSWVGHSHSQLAFCSLGEQCVHVGFMFCFSLLFTSNWCFGWFFFVAEITNYYRKLASTKKESICEDPPYIIDVSENQKKERIKC